MTWLSVKMAEVYCGQWPEPNDPAFYFSVFSQREMEIAHFHRRSWKESKSCLFVCRTTTFGRREKNFLMEPWSSSQYGKKEKKLFFSPTRCLWEHSTFSSICFFITVQAWTNESSKSPRDFCCFLKHLRFLSTIYQKTKFSFISSGKEWKWSLSLAFFFC